METNLKLWVEHPDLVWERADVLESYEHEYLVKSTTSNLSFRYSKSKAYEVDPSHLVDYSNLCLMNNLHEAPLIDLVRRRYLNGQTYTKIGTDDIIVSVNPYENLPGANDYLNEYDTAIGDDSKLTPHVYSTANIALKSLMGNDYFTDPINSNQSILISGESGAGKTEASKLVIKYLINHDDKRNSSVDTNNTGSHLNSILTSSNWIFESFGNAKTIKNHNSSRFGKYLKLYYSSDNKLVSASAQTFLLERSRLVSYGPGERNYHIFYMLLNSAVASELGLKSVSDYIILNEGKSVTLKEENSDKDSLQHLMNSFRDLNFTQDEVSRIWKLLTVLLNLGNIKLSQVEEGVRVKLECEYTTLDEIAGDLGVPSPLFKNALTSCKVLINNRNSLNVKVLSISDVDNNIKGLIKWLYYNLFNCLISKVNIQFSNDQSLKVSDSYKYIGILDIFGFEVLSINSLEQLCINYTNERLQNYFNEAVFLIEQNEYQNQGVEWKEIAFKNNQSVLDVIAKPATGILQQLEEYSSLNRKPDDMAMLSQIASTIEKSKSESFVKKFKDQFFTIKHFAGDVVYGILLYYFIFYILYL
jgi:myosin heavy subunit